MPLDATVGSVTANSYVTIQEADDYFALRAYADWWDTLVSKDKFLVTASQQLDWFLSWKGSKTYSDQAMGWPRTGVIIAENEFPDNIIPVEVKKAVYELALSSKEIDRSGDQELDGLSEVRAGSLMIKTDTTLYANKFEPVPDKVKKVVKGFIVNSGIGIVHLIRA